MAGYNSKFTGQQVDSLLEKAGSSYQKPETGIPQSDLDESTQQILQNVGDKVNKEEGKGLSTNDFTDEYKAKVEDSASQEGYFPKMSVGIAANLAGRGEATEQVFTYRPTDGGTSIESGVAKIRRVKGNSVVWNNKVQLTKTAESRGGITVTVDSDGLLLNGTATENALIRLVDIGYYNYIGGHKYFLSYHTTGYNSGQVQFVDYSLSIYIEYNKTSVIFDASTTARCNLLMIVNAGTTLENYRISGVILTDLTQMFGVGNEPDTVEEFRALYPDSYYPYNAGELRNLSCFGIRTVGFNQWDEVWELGYISTTDGLNYDSTTCICSAGYIRCFPNTEYYISDAGAARVFAFYDADKKFIGYTNRDNLCLTPTNCVYIRFFVEYGTNVSTYNNDICINLHHTGWRDGDYEPYKEFTHSLPLSQITNGEPLRKVGSVYDEINETHYIKRVGVRPYTEGDEDDATLLTDGTNTNYPLAEPIVTPIETPLNLDYQVEDFGTEEALLTDNSAPFSADIVYQFNAVDRIRENTLDIADLLARVIALENAAATTTSIPDITE